MLSQVGKNLDLGQRQEVRKEEKVREEKVRKRKMKLKNRKQSKKAHQLKIM